MPTSSCGLKTITMPSTGSDWNTVSGTSPVPGGISTYRQSTSPQHTSVQNCLTVPAIRLPRQITGSVSCSSSRLMDMTFTPFLASCGRMPSSLPTALSWMPRMRGILGPVMSASSTPAIFPRRAVSHASRPVTSDFPTPPLPLTTPMTFFTRLPAFAGASKLCGFCRDAHALPHEEQSCVHFSAIMFTSASDSWGIIASVWKCVKLS